MKRNEQIDGTEFACLTINADLETENEKLKKQLAESERKAEEYKKCNCKECMTDYEKNLNQIIDKYLNENIKLKQQLAENGKEIEKLNACVDFYKSYYISFNEKVIDELEKVKEFVSRQLFITTKDCNDLDEAEAKGCNELREETIKEYKN